MSSKKQPIFLTQQICEQICKKKNVLVLNFWFFYCMFNFFAKTSKNQQYLRNYFLKATTTTLRVRYGETDKMGIVYYGNYATYLEQGRTEWLRDMGFSYKWMETNGIHLPVVELHIKYKAPARYDDVLKITTTLKKIPTYRIEFSYQIHNQKGQLLITGDTTLVFVNTTTNKLQKAPDYLLDKLK